MVVSALLMAIAFAFMPGASASVFLQSRNNDLQEITRTIIKQTLLSEFGMHSTHTKKFEADLHQMFVALPKNEQGTLDPVTVRYALHRYFVQKHGWYIKGLEPMGQAWNSSLPTSVLTSRVPAYIQSLFDEQLHGKGIGIHELAAFAATLSEFVHNEALSDVMALYSALQLDPTAPVKREDAESVIKAYVLQTLEGNGSIAAREDIPFFEQEIVETFPDWEDFKFWVEDLRKTFSLERSRRSMKPDDLSLDSLVEDVQGLNDRLGAFQDINCRSLKSALAEMEYQGTGRVLLSEFYRVGLEGKFLFVEYADYLRRLGALDERDPEHPTVIIANYLGGPANCMISTSFHSVCCFDECEGLLGQLEASIRAPSATASRIAALVAGLQSDTVDAPRNLSAALLSRLGEIAELHGGAVPLHGRLFAQWMHHAYPLECPYPHAAGTTNPLGPDEWLEETETDEIAAPEDERKRITMKVKPSITDNQTEALLPWLAVEELVVPQWTQLPKASRQAMPRKTAAFALVVALAIAIVKTMTTYMSRCEAKQEKCLV